MRDLGLVFELVMTFDFAPMIPIGINVAGVPVNPARSFGPALFAGGKAMVGPRMFIVAPLAGGELAGLLHRTGVTRAVW